ncbi:MAG: YjbQ family protein [Candidatus Aenigmarchaeota archaeon]|nr:YjbQ family protein [Candidatus Aenigmarchaeota archaeon]
MAAKSFSFSVLVESNSLIGITERIEKLVQKSGVENGICNVFSAGSTGAIIINENEGNLIDDLKKLMKDLVPEGEWHHPENAHSHLRAMLAKSEATVPVADGNLQLGTWQSIFICNFDTRRRERKIMVTVVGE